MGSLNRCPDTEKESTALLYDGNGILTDYVKAFGLLTRTVRKEFFAWSMNWIK